MMILAESGPAIINENLEVKFLIVLEAILWVSWFQSK